MILIAYALAPYRAVDVNALANNLATESFKVYPLPCTGDTTALCPTLLSSRRAF